MPESTLDYYTEELNIYYTQEARSLYGQYGGYASLDGGNYTVFGQVFDGLDIVYAISQVDTDANDKPRDAVYIDSVTVEQYDGSAVRFYPADYALQ